MNRDSHIRQLSHATLPVRDRYRAARFYVSVLNSKIVKESDPDRAKKGFARSLQVEIEIFPGFHVSLFEQDYGQPELDQAHPHFAFDVPPEDMDKWVEQLDYWKVPHAGPVRRKGSPGVELYFKDPDGNNLEINCHGYAKMESLPFAPYDHSLLAYKEPWPSPELEPKADELLKEALARMRQGKDRAAH